MKKCWLISLIFLVYVNSYAACPAPVGNTYTAIDCSSSEVQDCIDDAISASGGVVIIPAGSATYTEASYVSKAITKDLIIRGSGQSTVITDNSANNNLPAFWFQVDGSVRFEISNIKIIGNSTISQNNGSFWLHGTSQSKIIHDIYFDMTGCLGGRMLKIGSYTDASHGAGVIYRNTFYNPTDKGQSVSIFGQTYGDYNCYSGNPTFGTASAYYIEGNSFINTTGDGDGALDAYAGAKIVCRYNTVSGTGVGWHGNDSSTGLHSIEVYRNNIIDPSDLSVFSVGGRGGTAIIWGNTLDSNIPPTFSLSNYRSCDILGFEPASLCNGSGTRDGNSDATGWPCYQQIGVTGNNGITQWPIVEWDNTVAGVVNNGSFSLNPSFLGANCVAFGHGAIYDTSDHIKEERDYINHDSCSDSVDNDGDGLTDMDDPQCIAFWDNVNSKALLNGSAYTPYTCPHPLAGSGSCDSGTAGTGGYHFGNMGIGSGAALTIGSGAAITLN